MIAALSKCLLLGIFDYRTVDQPVLPDRSLSLKKKVPHVSSSQITVWLSMLCQANCVSSKRAELSALDSHLCLTVAVLTFCRLVCDDSRVVPMPESHPPALRMLCAATTDVSEMLAQETQGSQHPCSVEKAENIPPGPSLVSGNTKI